MKRPLLPPARAAGLLAELLGNVSPANAELLQRALEPLPAPVGAGGAGGAGGARGTGGTGSPSPVRVSDADTGKPRGDAGHTGSWIDTRAETLVLPAGSILKGQMWAAIGAFSDRTQVVTSPLRRCCAFAQAVAERCGLPLAVYPRLREVGFGAWEGKRHEEVRDAAGGLLRVLSRRGEPPPARLRAARCLLCPGARGASRRRRRACRGPRAPGLSPRRHAGGHRARARDVPLRALCLHAPYAGRIRLRRTERGIELWLG